MNYKNKNNSIYIDYKLSAEAFRAGLIPDVITAYWFRNDKQIYPADRITKFKDWDRFYIPAVTGDQLNEFIPKNTVILRVDNKLWKAELPLEKIFAVGNSEAEAKLNYLKKLINKKLIKI